MSTKQIHDVPIENLTTQSQPRKEFEPSALAGMAQTIIEVGILEPLLVRRSGEDLIITDGERRWRAAKLAGCSFVPVIIEEEASTAKCTQRQLIANCQREDLRPLELAEAIGQLMSDAGWSAATVAEKLGLSPATISRQIALLSLPESIRESIRTGAIASSAAYELSRVANVQEQAELAEQLAAGTLTRDGLSGRIKHGNRRGNSAKPGLSRLTVSLDAQRTVTLAGPGLSELDHLIHWLTELLDRARKARPKGITLVTFTRMLKDEAKRKGTP